MILAVDIGNSNVKLGVFKGSELIQLESFVFSQFKTSLEKIVKRFPEIKCAAVCDVAKKVEEIEEVCSLFAIKVFRIDSNVKTNFLLRYSTPQTIGPDRLAVVAGAIVKFPQKPLLIIDAGTAITYEFVDNSGNYLGGNISPGIVLRFKALNQFTGSLPLVERSENFSNIGQSTEEAIRNGVMVGIVKEIEGIIFEFKQQNPQSKVILTGGDANFLHKSIKSDIFVLPNLVLEGIYEIYKINQIN